MGDHSGESDAAIRLAPGEVFEGVEATLGEIRVLSRHVHARMSSVTLGTLSASSIDGGPLSLLWQRRDAEQQQKYLFCFLAGGSAEVVIGGRRSSITGAGLHIALPGEASIAIEISRKSRVVLFSFHRSDVAPLVLDEALLKRSAGTSSPIFQAAFGYLWGLASLPGLHPRIDDSTIILADLTRHTARSLTRAFHSGIAEDADLEERTQRVIERDHAHPGISVDHIAAELGVSRRTLERRFSARGMSVADMLRRARTRHAVALMRSRADVLFEVVARESGFGSVASLRRSVMREHGMSLSQLRDASRSSARPSEN